MPKEYGPLKLPKSGIEIYFREPTGGDRLDVLKQNPIGTEDVMSGSTLVDLYLAAKCATKVDGKETSGDYKHLFDKWPNSDTNYYQSVFRKVFEIDENTMGKLDATVDFLLKGFGSADSSTLTTTAAEQ